MNTPPLLAGAALLFWGWQTGLLAAAIPLALVLEAHRIVPWRMDLANKDFSRLWKICAAAFLGVMAVVYVTDRAAFLRALQWTPVIFFPIIAAQSFSTNPAIDSRVFFLWIRTKPVNLAYPSVMLALGSACAARERSAWFFPLLAALTGWTLWSSRPSRSSRIIWVVLLLSVSVAGFAGALSLRGLQKIVEDLYIGTFQQETDMSGVATAIGEIGKRKQSASIVLRARDRNGRRDPLYLMKTSYNAYRGTSWLATSSALLPVRKSGGTWLLADGGSDQDVLEVSMPLDAGEGFLVLPQDAAAIRDLAARSLSVNRMGAVKAEGGPGLATYVVLRSGNLSLLGPPDASDLLVPNMEEPAIAALAAELRLPSFTGHAVLDRVQQFFQDRFVYTLDLPGGREYATPLADFLLRTRAGHCEYFATGAALLLRKAGIPARYAVGYLAHEFSPMEDALVVRSRDAHAWVVAYVDGAWREFDPTPQVWIEDQGSVGMFGSLKDLCSYISFRFSRWRWGGNTGRLREYGLVAALPVLAFLFWRFRKRFAPAGRPPGRSKGASLLPGGDSPFYEIERFLSATEWERRSGETYAAWLGRIDGRKGLSTKPLAEALAIHNRYRFDPRGISDAERRTLAAGVAAWLRETRKIARGAQ